jgi:hypothetical protein
MGASYDPKIAGTLTPDNRIVRDSLRLGRDCGTILGPSSTWECAVKERDSL